ncbi:alkaline phosphatase D family protein [Kitasatospora sp. NPDC059327]|uniref:alkaline phosphatase D family protein n=1 Tax=Kitasatospora sp. NPDC059327 TaxID=3346803 RepID=UPI00368D6183
MDDSSRSPSEISRRRVVQLLGVGAAATAAGTTVASPAVAAPAAADPLPPLRAAVLEYPDPWTKAVGLSRLLTGAGFTVVPLDTTRAATAQGVDLIAFGSFTNNGPDYYRYVSERAESLREFVRLGGVVLDLAQSDQNDTAAVPYLPATMNAVRTDDDYHTIYRRAAGHPLVSALPEVSGQVFTGRAAAVPVSWETVGSWQAMRVLLACGSADPAPAALLEGARGAGRFLVSSLTVDKCYAAVGGAEVQPGPAVRDSLTFFTALAGYVGRVKAGTAPAVVATAPRPLPSVGPLVGHVDESTARVWARPGQAASYANWRCKVRSVDWERTFTATISAANDDTLLVDVSGLRANTRYDFTISPEKAISGFVPLTGSFRTAPAAGAAAKVVMGLGSCADTVANPVWTRIIDEGCDSFVMLGDTPYADVSVPGVNDFLTQARTQHRRFLAVPEIAGLVRSMPVWGTWDDHDFAGNDSDGTWARKYDFRKAFVDYRANASFGHATGVTGVLTDRSPGEGVYTSFRRGPVEVFLIDPRWFSDKTTKVCLGSVQRAWLERALLASTATFKVLASGMVWYDKVHTESDDWNTYRTEKDALLAYIKDKRISGCVLVSGDIHVSRAVKNFDGTPDYVAGTPDTPVSTPAGYDLWEYVVSPLHGRTLGTVFDVSTAAKTGATHPTRWNAATPAQKQRDPVKWSKDEPFTFLKLEADTTVKPARLTAQWINRDGAVLHTQIRTIDELTPPPA